MTVGYLNFRIQICCRLTCIKFLRWRGKACAGFAKGQVYKSWYFWVMAMATLAVTSFFITGLRPGRFSAIHLLSILVLASLAHGLWLIRHRRIRAHAIHMQALYLQALLGAGLFTFLPGRMMSQVLFSQTPTLGFGCAVFVFGAVYWYWRRQILRLELS